MEKRSVKKGISIEETRRRREVNMTTVRKEKKEEGLSKRRNITGVVSSEETPEVQAIAQKDALNMGSMLSAMRSADAAQQLDGLRRFRRLLSAAKNPPVQACIDTGAVPLVVEFLSRHSNPELQFEAAWALTNIASTNFTSVIVVNGAIPPLVALLRSPSADVREQCAWCLGNVAGDGADLRSLVLGHGALAPLIENITHPANLSLLRNCTWTLSNLCRGKPAPDVATMGPAYQVLASLVLRTVDQDTLTDAIWALSYLSDGDDTRIGAVASLDGLIPRLVQLLGSSPDSTVIPTLRTLGNMVSGNDSQTQAVVDAGVLTAVCPLLRHTKKNIRKESCWLLSNVAAGSSLQLAQLVGTPSLIPLALEQASASSEWDVRREAAWVITNVISGGNAAQVSRLVEYGVVKPLCDLLDVGDARVLLITMDAIATILKNDSDCTRIVDEAEGIEKLEKLQEHESEDVYRKAVSIIETYFGGDDDDDAGAENMAPRENANNYTFAIPSVSSTNSKEAFTFGGASFSNPSFAGDLGLFRNGM